MNEGSDLMVYFSFITGNEWYVIVSRVVFSYCYSLNEGSSERNCFW